MFFLVTYSFISFLLEYTRIGLRNQSWNGFSINYWMSRDSKPRPYCHIAMNFIYFGVRKKKMFCNSLHANNVNWSWKMNLKLFLRSNRLIKLAKAMQRHIDKLRVFPDLWRGILCFCEQERERRREKREVERGGTKNKVWERVSIREREREKERL